MLQTTIIIAHNNYSFHYETSYKHPYVYWGLLGCLGCCLGIMVNKN